jgi:hypothetical protein
MTTFLLNRPFRFKTIFIAVFLVAGFSSGISLAQDQENNFHVGLVYPISSHGIHARDYTNVFSLHALAGVSKGEKGVAIAGFSNIITNDANGCQIAGFSNHIGGYADGFQAAGFINTYNSAKGFQVAGFANIARNNVTGMQLAGFINTARDRNGSQVAGFINIAGDVKGQQLAGFMNTSGNVNGVQIAGFINVAKKVKGVQLAGFINIADSSVYPIGIINIIKNGEQTIGLSTDDNLTTLVTFRSGGDRTYGIIGVGHNFKNNQDVYSIQFGLGAHLIERRGFRLNAEATTIMLENFKRGSFTKQSLSLLPAVKLFRNIEIFGGPSFNFVNTDSKDGKELVGNYLWDRTNKNNHLSGLYVGYTAGLQMKL